MPAGASPVTVGRPPKACLPLLRRSVAAISARDERLELIGIPADATLNATLYAEGEQVSVGTETRFKTLRC